MTRKRTDRERPRVRGGVSELEARVALAALLSSLNRNLDPTVASVVVADATRRLRKEGNK